VTAKKAFEIGLRVDSTANIHTLDGLVQSVVAYYKNQRGAA